MLESSADILEAVEVSLNHRLEPVRRRQFIHNYKKAMQAESNELRRSRLLVVGQGRAGKSSLIRALHARPFDELSPSTVGVDVQEYNLRDVGVSVSTNLAASAVDGTTEWTAAGSEVDEAKRAARANAKFKGGGRRASEMKKDLLNFGNNKATFGDDADTTAEARHDFETAAATIEDRAPVEAPRRGRGASDEIQTAKETAESTQVQRKVHSGPTADKSNEGGMPSCDPEDGRAQTVEQDAMTAADDLAGEDGTGRELLFSTWDYGGQRIFQKVQHLYLTRFAVYVLAFNLSDILDESKRGEALSYIGDWYSAIDRHARDKRPNRDDEDRMLPPVMLVGMHLDEVSVSSRVDSLKRVDAILRGAQFKGLEPFHSPPEHIRNKEQDLVFFPVSNRDPKDENLAKLRRLIFLAAEEDRPAFVNQSVPVSWLKCITAINKLAKDIPLVQLFSENPDHETIVTIMLNCGALQDSESKAERQIGAAAMMKVLNELGIVVYFDDVPGMSNYCIVHPQWIVDCISSMVRDFTLHRIGMDRHAMRLNNSTDWENMVDGGLVSEGLLRRLWASKSEYHDFLVKLMHKLGLFATLPLPSLSSAEGNRVVYFVPSSAMRNTDAVVSESTVARDAPRIHFEGDIPNGFYERVLTQLVSNWVKAKGEMQKPELTPAIRDRPAKAKLWFHAVHATLSLDLLASSASIGVHFDEAHVVFANTILCLVREAVDEVNVNLYSGELRFEFQRFGAAGLQQQCRGEPLPAGGAMDVKDSYGSQAPHESEETVVDLLTPWLQKLQFSAQEARKTAQKLLFHEDGYSSPQEMKRAYTSYEEFLEELKNEYEVSTKSARIIVRALEKMDHPEDAKELVAGIFGGDNLDNVKPEELAITKTCLRNNFLHKSEELVTQEDFSTFITGLNERFKILHLAMHCSPAENGFALKFKTNKVDSEVVTKRIGQLCVRTDGHEGGTVECVFLNACNSAEIARKLQEEDKVPVVIGWSTPASDVAARWFGKTFYDELINKAPEKNSCGQELWKYEHAFEMAKNDLEMRKYAIADPRGWEPDLKRPGVTQAAGIPEIYYCDGWMKRRQEERQQAKCGGVMHIDIREDQWCTLKSGEASGSLGQNGHTIKNDLTCSVRVAVCQDRGSVLEIVVQLFDEESNPVVDSKEKIELQAKKSSSTFGLQANASKDFLDTARRIGLRLNSNEGKANLSGRSHPSLPKDPAWIMPTIGMNIHNLPDEYQDLFPDWAYKKIIDGCTHKDNWRCMRQGGFDAEPVKVLQAMPPQPLIHCYCFAGRGNVDTRHFAYAARDGRQLSPDEYRKLANVTRRMWTGLYDDMDVLTKDSEAEFMEKLNAENERRKGARPPESLLTLGSETVLQIYKTNAWFWSPLEADKGAYMEIIFGGEEIVGNETLVFSEQSCAHLPQHGPKKQKHIEEARKLDGKFGELRPAVATSPKKQKDIQQARDLDGKLNSESSTSPADKTLALESLSCQQVVVLLKKAGLGKYSKLITENEADGATLECTETLEEVKELELDDLKFKPVAHAKKLLKLIARWKEEGVDPCVFR